MSIVYDFRDIGAHPLRELVEGDIESIPECEECSGTGWECYGIGSHDPHFRECRKCHNPKGFPSL